jgi:RNA polymerase sigma-70 factor, ECF subfamily
LAGRRSYRRRKTGIFTCYIKEADVQDHMSGDSIRLALPFSRLATGCQASTLYRELRKPLLRYLVCLGLSADEAQDVAQDAFLSLHRHLASGGPQQNIRGWLFRVAHNAARNRQQRYERRFVTPLEDGYDLAGEEASPERVFFDKEKFGRLRKAIRLLTESELECLLLRAGGLRYREIGEVLGLSTSTVADTVERAVRKLAENCHV